MTFADLFQPWPTDLCCIGLKSVSVKIEKGLLEELQTRLMLSIIFMNLAGYTLWALMSSVIQVRGKMAVFKLI